MSASEHFRCPACNAKLKFGRHPKTRVTCPRCGHEFDHQLPAEVLDPFAHESDDKAPPSDAQEQIGETTEFGMLLQAAAAPPRPARRDIDFDLDSNDVDPDDVVDEPPPEDAEEDYGAPLPIGRTRPPSASKEKPKVFAKTKSGKKKRKLAKALKDAIWLYLAGAGLLALTLFIGYVTFRPGAILGRSLTFDEVAGTYVSEQHPGLKIILGTDGTWGVEDQSQGGDLRIDGLVYSIKGRKIVCDAPEELKLKPRPKIFLDLPAGLHPRSIYERIAAEFSDMSFKNGTLVSPTRGRFTRQPEPNEEERADARPDR
ncbi:MAG TPA: hypothetical protein VG055_18000 [Planctomycetaceae bacterium]|jgi:hypothetical protein|nr:hypothetical protein [Planctomycetaceae bacterium]